MAKKAVFQLGPIVLLFLAFVALQHFMNGGPYHWSLPDLEPLGTFGIVSWLALVSAVNAAWNATRSGRQFMYYDLSFAPSLVVLYGGVQAIANGLPDVGYYVIQFVGAVFVVFLVGVFTKNLPGVRTLNMDDKMHVVAFWTVHGVGALVALFNIL